jgi:hypothetical protein
MIPSPQAQRSVNGLQGSASGLWCCAPGRLGDCPDLRACGEPCEQPGGPHEAAAVPRRGDEVDAAARALPTLGPAPRPRTPPAWTAPGGRSPNGFERSTSGSTRQGSWARACSRSSAGTTRTGERAHDCTTLTKNANANGPGSLIWPHFRLLSRPPRWGRFSLTPPRQVPPARRAHPPLHPVSPRRRQRHKVVCGHLGRRLQQLDPLLGDLQGGGPLRQLAVGDVRGAEQRSVVPMSVAPSSVRHRGPLRSRPRSTLRRAAVGGVSGTARRSHRSGNTCGAAR